MKTRAGQPDEEHTAPEAEARSRSARKRVVEEIQELGEALLELRGPELAASGLAEPLLGALLAAQSMQRIALRRQKLYIGKLLRALGEPELRAVRDLVEQRAVIRGARAADLQRVERWRSRLLAEGDAAIEELLLAYPRGDRPSLRQLVRAAQRQAALGKPRVASRKLFGVLRELFGAPGETSDEAEPGETERSASSGALPEDEP